MSTLAIFTDLFHRATISFLVEDRLTTLGSLAQLHISSIFMIFYIKLQKYCFVLPSVHYKIKQMNCHCLFSTVFKRNISYQHNCWMNLWNVSYLHNCWMNLWFLNLFVDVDDDWIITLNSVWLTFSCIMQYHSQ